MLYPLRTHEGIKYMSFYILLSLVLNLISFAFVMGSIINPFVAIGIACFVLVMAILLFIIFILALIKLFTGKDEFGPEHSKNVMLGLYLFIAIIVLTIVSSIVISALTFTLVLSGDLASLWMIMVVPAFIGIITSFCWGYLIFLFVKIFTTPEEKGRANIAIGLYVTGGIVNMIVAILIAAMFLYIDPDATNAMSYTGSIFTVFANILFYLIYKAILDRFDMGQITVASSPTPPGYGQAPYQMPGHPWGPPPQHQQPYPPSRHP
jgi:hypothetical protein